MLRTSQTFYDYSVYKYRSTTSKITVQVFDTVAKSDISNVSINESFLFNKEQIYDDKMYDTEYATLEQDEFILDGLFKGVKNIVDGIIKICKGDLKGGLQLIFKGIANICIGLVNSCISAAEGLINIVIDGINVLLGGISDIASGVGSLFGLSPVNIRLNKVSFSRIPSLNVGTNYVPNDMLAQIHRGEAIIPKKFNSSDFFGNTSAEELTLLANIVDQLEELNKKDTTINLDGDNVAEKINNRLESLKQRQGNRVFALAR